MNKMYYFINFFNLVDRISIWFNIVILRICINESFWVKILGCDKFDEDWLFGF